MPTPAPAPPPPAGVSVSTAAPLAFYRFDNLLEGPKPPVQQVSLKKDIVFHTEKKYEAYPLDALLARAQRQYQFDTTNAVVVFQCTDGYRPTMPWAQAFGARQGYLAFHDLDAPAGKMWPDSVAGKFAPYYLIWADFSGKEEGYPWPYGLEGFNIVAAGEAFKGIYPADAPQVARGFALFRDHCYKCHAMNGAGGTMGPELNSPKNITEYWSETDILKFVQNPQGYRLNAKMPAQPQLSEADIKEVIGYLKYMAGKK